MRAALIDKTGLVVNVILCDKSWKPPDGFTLVESDTASPTDKWDGKSFIAQIPPKDAKAPDMVVDSL